MQIRKKRVENVGSFCECTNLLYFAPVRNMCLSLLFDMASIFLSCFSVLFFFSMAANILQREREWGVVWGGGSSMGGE